jgi:hypothetical protein
MNFRNIVPPIVGVVLLVGAYRASGWLGVGLVATGLVTWALLHFTRIMRVLQRASDRPVGFVDSAVMLNAKLKPGVNLLHVMAMTKALGEQLSEKDADPELYRWTDGSASSVTCTFAKGKLVKWELVRPEAPAEAAPPLAP